MDFVSSCSVGICCELHCAGTCGRHRGGEQMNIAKAMPCTEQLLGRRLERLIKYHCSKS